MAIIAPLRYDITNASRVKKHSAGLRFWHWANTIAISGSLITVLVNATLLKRRNISPLVQNELKGTGITVNSEQAGDVAHALNDKVWQWHTYIGYALAALLLLRLILEFFQLADQRFLRKLINARNLHLSTRLKRQQLTHEVTVKIIYAIFYALLLVMVVTGLFLAFEDELAAFKPIRHSVKEVHGFCMYLILFFIAIHLIGVLLAERKDGKGIVSDMINGGSSS